VNIHFLKIEQNHGGRSFTGKNIDIHFPDAPPH
jgi:hypothetical protein